MTDEKSDAFGIGFTRPDRPLSMVRYLNTAHVKVDLAEWHRMQFETEEDALTREDFFRGGNDPFLPAQAHADGVVLQLGGAFDSFGCAVAHGAEVANPDRASFDTRNAQLAKAAGGELGARIRSIGEGTDYRGLLAYRHLAAHRGVIAEGMRGRPSESEGRDEVVFMLDDWLAPEAPDLPRAPVRPILELYVTWARLTIGDLRSLAIATWGLEGDEGLISS